MHIPIAVQRKLIVFVATSYIAASAAAQTMSMPGAIAAPTAPLTSTTSGLPSATQPAVNAEDQANASGGDDGAKDRKDSRGDLPAKNREVKAQAPTDFQILVQETTGRRLPIYGASLFENAPSTFAPVDNVPVTPEYAIGPGDEIILEVWGQARFRNRYTVDRSGNISLPDVGSIHVAGIPYEKLQGYIRSQLERVYRNFDLNINLGQLRSIQIFVLGNVTQPGSFTVSSLSTLVNALFASGGPSPSGSLRRIQLKRASGFTQDFDLYDLLLRGDKSKDIALLPGDVIFVPPVGAQIAIAGSVNTPAIYELRNEKTIEDALQLAGGLTVTADPAGTRVERIDAHKDRTVVDVDMAAKRGEGVRAGDVLIVGAISGRINNAVTLRGNVQNPGRYRWHPGMRIRDLIPDKAALLTRDYYRAHNQLGLISETDYSLNSSGRLQVKSDASDTGGKDVTVATSAGSDTPSAGFTPKNDVVLSAADINWNYAVIERQSTADLTTSLIPFNLGKVVLEGDSANNIPLEQGDIVTIFSKADIEVPVAQRTRFVRLEGEFVGSGVYSVLPGETLRSLVHRAGGLSADAYLFGSEFRRESTRKLQQQRLNEYIDNLEADASETATRIAQQGSQSTRTVAITPAQIERLRSLRATGRIVLNLTPSSAGIDQIPDIALEDGDRFVVPRVPAVVGVAGAVYNASSFLYSSAETVDRYLQMAGGPTRRADRNREFVIRADGSIISRQYHSSLMSDGFKHLKLAAGDTIIVPTRTTVTDPMRTLLDIAQIVGQFGIGVAAINVLR